MTLHDDRTFMRHFTMVLLGLAGMTIFLIFLAFLIVGVTGVSSHTGYSYVAYVKAHPQAAPARPAPKKAAKAVAAATAKPAGAATGKAVAAAEPPSKKPAATAAGAAKVAATQKPKKLDGHAIWQAHCAMCHQTGIAGAPKIGDKKAWAPILAEASLKTIFHRDINGYTGKRGTMPAKGGSPSLSDAQVIAAAKYMIGKSGGHPGS